MCEIADEDTELCTVQKRASILFYVKPAHMKWGKKNV